MELTIIKQTNEKPSTLMTDNEWQQTFNHIKGYIKPIAIKKLGGKDSTEPSRWNNEFWGSYCGSTNWQQYCTFINDILSHIRHGHVDYCYFTYQIYDLLKFEKDSLKTQYHPEGQYFEIWLEK